MAQICQLRSESGGGGSVLRRTVTYVAPNFGKRSLNTQGIGNFDYPVFSRLSHMDRCGFRKKWEADGAKWEFLSAGPVRKSWLFRDASEDGMEERSLIAVLGLGRVGVARIIDASATPKWRKEVAK